MKQPVSATGTKSTAAGPVPLDKASLSTLLPNGGCLRTLIQLHVTMSPALPTGQQFGEAPHFRPHSFGIPSVLRVKIIHIRNREACKGGWGERDAHQTQEPLHIVSSLHGERARVPCLGPGHCTLLAGSAARASPTSTAPVSVWTGPRELVRHLLSWHPHWPVCSGEGKIANKPEQ